jgi:hypothetical protein
MGNDVLYDGSSLASTRIGRVPDEHQAAERRAATRAVAGNFARDAGDCAELLAMLGLTPQDGLTTRKQVQA